MTEYIFFLLGLLALIKGADFLVDGSSVLAKKLGVSNWIIGLTIVSFGTSLPELFVSLFASTKNTPDIIFGNIIGSNISNTLLILGITATIINLSIKRETIKKEIPFSLLGIIILLVFANKTILSFYDSTLLTRTDGFILLFFFATYIYHLFETAKKEKRQNKERIVRTKPYYLSISLVLLGAALLYFGGEWTVNSASTIARQIGLSEFLISATIIAIGTSLPELVTSTRAAMKKSPDIAVANIIGSNIFNIFWILGLTSLFLEIPIPSFINADLIILGLATIMLLAFMFVGKKNILTRKEGIALLSAYVAYLIFIIIRG